MYHSNLLPVLGWDNFLKDYLELQLGEGIVFYFEYIPTTLRS